MTRNNDNHTPQTNGTARHKTQAKASVDLAYYEICHDIIKVSASRTLKITPNSNTPRL